MRYFLTALFALLAAPVFAQGWARYDDARLGYSVEIPAEFEAQGADGDGQDFVVPGRVIALSVRGGATENFDSAVAAAMRQDASDGWNQTSQTVTPRWADWSASANGQILHRRMILLCDGQSYAALRATYGTQDRAELDPIIARSAASLRATAC